MTELGTVEALFTLRGGLIVGVRVSAAQVRVKVGSWIRFAAAEPVRAIGVKPWPTADLLDLLVPADTPPPAIGDAVVVLDESPATPELRGAGRAGRSDVTSDEAS